METDGPGRFGLVVVHYRDLAAVARLLHGRDGWTLRPVRTAVVDNSCDLPDDLDAVVVRPGENLGYAGAVNLGIETLVREVPGLRAVLVCTQDALLEPDAAERLLATLEADERAAVAAPLLAYASSPRTVFSDGGLLLHHGYGIHPHQGTPMARAGRGPVGIDWADGAVLMLDVQAVQSIGGFDERYFLYVEEIDLQTRLRLAGRTVVLDRDAIAYQEPGALPSYLKYRNGVYFTRKLAPHLAPWPVARQLVRDSIRALVRRRRFAPLWALRGVLDARADRMGPPPARLLERGGPGRG